MPLYFFHEADSHITLDSDGTDLPDDRAAGLEAIKLIGAELSFAPGLLTPSRQFRVEVADVNNTLLFTVIVLAFAPATARAGRRA